ncbi:hypothetical protein A3Q56_06671 [Intoshia linei]|uniref:Uncharacterized protein n=1 Tax=Intoshia linei TaxID=1819745 RepID=A0A177AUA9_9BILA|nr:hypothetical protein A3Q56_06671 [Intoshia linei]
MRSILWNTGYIRIVI